MSQVMCAAPRVRGRRAHGAPGKADGHMQEQAASVEHGYSITLVRSQQRLTAE